MNLLMGLRLLVDFELHSSDLTFSAVRHAHDDVFEVDNVPAAHMTLYAVTPISKIRILASYVVLITSTLKQACIKAVRF